MSPAGRGGGGPHHLPHADAGRLHHGPVGDGASGLLLDVRIPREQLLYYLPAGQTRGDRGPPSGPRGGEALGALAGRGAYFTFRYSSRVMRPSLSESYMWNRTGGAERGSVREVGGQPGAPAPPPSPLGNLPHPEQSHGGQGQGPRSRLATSRRVTAGKQPHFSELQFPRLENGNDDTSPAC